MEQAPLQQPIRRPTSRQLPLPLEPAVDSSPPWQPLPAITIQARQVWVTLPPALQTRVRQSLLAILQEALYDHQPS